MPATREKRPFSFPVLRLNWRGGPAGKVLAKQTRGHEFDPHHLSVAVQGSREVETEHPRGSPDSQCVHIGDLRLDAETQTQNKVESNLKKDPTC